MIKKVKLGDLVQIDSGYAFKSNLFNQDNNGLPLIRIRDISSGACNTFYSGEYDDKYLVNNGELLIGMDGSFQLRNWQAGTALLNQRVCRIKSVNSLLENKYLEFVLPLHLKKIEDKTSFVTVKHLSVKDIQNIELILPSVEQQMKIAKILDQAQELIDKRKAQIEALDELIKNVFYDMFGDPYYNNKGYRVKKLKECIVDKTINGFFTANSNYSENGNVEVIWLSDFINNLYCQLDNLKKAKADDRERIKYKVQYGDILFCRSSLTKEGIGKASCIPKYVKENVIFECHIIKLRLDINEVIPEFFQVLSTTPYFRNQIIKEAKTSTMTTISQDSIEGCKIIVPPYKEQSKFLDFLDQVSKQKELLNESLVELENNFNSLMQRAFSGGSLR